MCADRIDLDCQEAASLTCLVPLSSLADCPDQCFGKRRMGSLATLLEGDFGFEQYVDLALNMPMLLVRRCAPDFFVSVLPWGMIGSYFTLTCIREWAVNAAAGLRAVERLCRVAAAWQASMHVSPVVLASQKI